MGAHDVINVPAAGYRIHNRIQVHRELASAPEGKLIHNACNVVHLNIEAGGAFFLSEVVNVLRVRYIVSGIGLERLFGIAHRFAPGERIQEVKSAGSTMLNARGKTIVVVVANRIDPADRAECRDGPARLYAESLAR